MKPVVAFVYSAALFFVLAAHSTLLAYTNTSPAQQPVYGINPPFGWADFTFAVVPPAAGTVTITITACADLNESNEYVSVNALGGKNFGNLFTGNSGTGCAGSCDSVVVTMTAGEWNAARSSSSGGVGGVRFDAAPSSSVTNICCSDTCSSSGPGGTSECCSTQCQPIPCYTGSIVFSVSYQEIECTTNGECNDGVACTVDLCVSNMCENSPDNGNCPDDGAYCNGSEFCHTTQGCISQGSPCPQGEICNEETDSCVECIDDNDCDDGLYCNGAETCVASTCQTGAGDPCQAPLGCDEATDSCRVTCTVQADCEDNNDCTIDACNSGFCSTSLAANGTSCDGGFWCSSGNDKCHAGVCVGKGSPCSHRNNYCNEVTQQCETDFTETCKGTTEQTVCQQNCLNNPPEDILRRFGDNGCPHSWTITGVPYVNAPAIMRTYAFGHYQGGSSRTYGVDMVGVGTVVSDLYYEATMGCQVGPEVVRYVKITPDQWNAAVDESSISGTGNVRFDFIPDGVQCGDCNIVNGGVAMRVTFLDEDDDCNANGVHDLCDIGGGASEDCDGDMVPDECQGGSVGAALIEKVPDHDETLPRTTKNTIWLTFACDISAPGSGEVMIQELQSGGTFGSDLSGSFTFSVLNTPGGFPRILKIVETTQTLTNKKWYAVRNTGSWGSADTFNVHYLTQRGDANNDGNVNTTDLGFINTSIPTFSPVPDNLIRKDVNGDDFINSTDLGVANAFIPGLPVSKPSGH